jgi:ATP-dependent DNA helicase RecQ
VRPGRFTLVRRRLGKQALSDLAREWEQRDQRDREKLDRMESYARSALCRWRLLREYFGEEAPEERCGVCDNCRKGLAQRAEGFERSERSSTPTSPTFQPGDRVSLPTFGTGEVEQVEEDSIVVRFPGGRARKFKSEFARPVPTSSRNQKR